MREEASNRDGLDPATLRTVVRDRYGTIAAGDDSSDAGSGCCSDVTSDGSYASALGYDAEDSAAVAPGADMGLGCGNPTAIDRLEPGETVLDLGSGGGFDCFLAAREVGTEGRVIGVDMTPEMVERARENRRKNDVSNVEFRLGEIEHLPVPDESVDVIISNCVINLSADKQQVFEEANRVLHPGGRVAITDVVATADIPPAIRRDPTALAACGGGAATIDEVRVMLEDAGFEDIAITPNDDSDEFIREWSDGFDLEEFIVSARIQARKPT